MEETKTPAQVLNGAAAHIEANGVLYNAWESEDGTEDLPPCCCVTGTLRLVAGLPPSPPRGRVGISMTETPVLKAAATALADQTRAERMALGGEFYGEGEEISIVAWSDHYADTEAVRRKGRDYEVVEWHRVEHEDGDRGHVARVLRQAALRFDNGAGETAHDRAREYLSQVPKDYWDKTRKKPFMSPGRPEGCES